MTVNNIDTTIKKIKGEIIKIIYYSSDTHYSVIILDTEQFKEKIKAVGTLLEPEVNDRYELQGEFIKDPKYGLEFEFETSKEILPTGKEGIRKFLQSQIYGVGEVRSEKIIEELGTDCLEKINDDPDILEQFDFLADEQIEELINELSKNENKTTFISNLCNKGLTVHTAEKIWNYYLSKDIPPEEIHKKIKNNPYRLIDDIKYFGFDKADELALTFDDIDRTSDFRVEATIKHILKESQKEGHVYLEKEDLLKRVYELLDNENITNNRVTELINKLNEENKLKVQEENIYLPFMFKAEKELGKMIKELVEVDLDDAYIEKLDQFIETANRNLEINLVAEQKQAVKKALTNNISIITGGPGTGKSTIIATICDIYDFYFEDDYIHLASPTGKAANRMEELTGFEAKTIHRLLEYRGEGFDTDYEIPAPGLLIIDEFSMCDLPLAYYLFKAINNNLKVVLVGDTNQLPSIGPGNVLRDLIDSDVIPTTKLKDNFRQSQGSKIISIANKITKGDIPYLADENDFEYKNIKEIKPLPYILDIFENLSADFNIFDLQVITPMNRGTLGVNNLNDKIQDYVNPKSGDENQLGRFRYRDKVMITKNNYNKMVFNGDMGIISRIGDGELNISLLHNNRVITFSKNQLKFLNLAYACTIHKAQGSEFPYVIMILDRSHKMMLRRNLVYTGLTRAQDKLLLMSEIWIFKKAIENNKVKDRNSMLVDKLMK